MLDISFRIKQLQILKEAMKKNEQLLLDVIYIDLKKSRYDAIITELSLIHGEISHTIRKLPGWSHRKRVGRNLLNVPEKSYLLSEL
jgi:aldehyde dehydrogenase (NAD+)